MHWGGGEARALLRDVFKSPVALASASRAVELSTIVDVAFSLVWCTRRFWSGATVGAAAVVRARLGDERGGVEHRVAAGRMRLNRTFERSEVNVSPLENLLTPGRQRVTPVGFKK